jgi:hypothetical protein
MLHLKKSFLSCMSLSTVLALGACGESESRFEQNARFSQASETEILATVQVVDLAMAASIMPILALFDADDGCPEFTGNGVVGNGCVTSGGTRYDGSFEIVENEVVDFLSVIYRDYRYSDDEFSFYLDGSLMFGQEADEKVRYDLDMTVEFRSGAGAEVERAEAEMSAICDVVAEGIAACIFEAGSAGKVEGLGGFTMEGFHQLGYASELGDGNTTEVTVQGTESLYYEYVGATDCYTYTIEGDEPQNSCDE